jgi:hypothetical protein
MINEIALQLADILKKQIENYDALKRLALEKRKSLSSNDLKALPTITGEIQAVATSNCQLEEERKNLAGRLAAALGLQEENPSLVTLAQCIGGSSGKRLLVLRDRAVAAIDETQRQNRINFEMLKYCADLTDSVLKKLIEPNPEQYYGTGKPNHKSAPAILLDRCF